MMEVTIKLGLELKILKMNFFWIKGVRLETKQENTYAHERYNEVVRKGIDHAMEICCKYAYKYDFLAVVDADVRRARES
jgi:hypothetical protein